MLEVADLRMLSAVAKCGNLTRAAARLNTTQSALSHRLASLEARLGTLMFERLGRSMRPTAAGARLAAESDGILERLTQATSTALDEGQSRCRTLRLATQCYTCYSWLPSVLSHYQSVCKNANVDIILEATSRIAAALLEDELDVGITIGPAGDRQLYSEPLFEDEILAVMHPEHRLASRAWIDAQDLTEENLISYDYPFEDSELIKRLFGSNKFMPKSLLRVPLTEAIVEMVKGGLGVSVLARWAVAAHLRAGSVCGRPLTNSGVRRAWHVTTLRSAAKRDYQEQFIQVLRAQLPRSLGSFRRAASA